MVRLSTRRLERVVALGVFARIGTTAALVFAFASSVVPNPATAASPSTAAARSVQGAPVRETVLARTARTVARQPTVSAPARKLFDRVAATSSGASYGALLIDDLLPTQSMDVYIDAGQVSVPATPLFTGLPAGYVTTSPLLLPTGTYSIGFRVPSEGQVYLWFITIVSGVEKSLDVMNTDLTDPTDPFTEVEHITVREYTNALELIGLGRSRFNFRNATGTTVDAYIDGVRVAWHLSVGENSEDELLTVGAHLIEVVPADAAPGPQTDIFSENILFAPTAYGTLYLAYSPSAPAATGHIGVAFAVTYEGYQFAAADSGVFSFGSYPFEGSEASHPLNAPIVAAGGTPSGLGYLEAAGDGGIFAFGDAQFYGSLGSTKLNAPIVSMALDPATGGYWMVGADGGIFSYNAPFFGSLGGQKIGSPIVAITADPFGDGYWIVAADGAVYAFGGAASLSSGPISGLRHNIAAMATTPDGFGYWLVGVDGSVFAYGDAGADGSMGGAPLNKPIVGIVPSADGLGYALVASDGGVFAFGTLEFVGSTGALRLNRPIVAAFF